MAAPPPTFPDLPLIHCEVIQALDNKGSLNLLVLCMDRPGLEHNIIDRRFALELARVVGGAKEKVEAGEVDLVVVCSAKKGSFMAGADIETELKFVGLGGHKNAYSDLTGLQTILCQLESLAVPTIAILNGTTLGGGLEIALACDFRIADSALCRQIGLPEVKIGVLPGAGGCVRLPRLIGLQKSLDLLISGRSITSTCAKELGLVDHLLSSTQSICRSSSSQQPGGAIYDYQWLNDVLNFLEQRKIGNQMVEVEKRGVATAVSAGMVKGGVYDGTETSEEEIIQSLMVDWERCEEKAKRKYPRKHKNFFLNVLERVFHAFLYSMAVLQLWWKVGLQMPAPYACLQTTFRCYYAGSWLEAMSLNALGLTTLVISPESKGLMSLFLLSRKLKKSATIFGLESTEKSRPFSELGCSVIVLVSKNLVRHWSAFVQGLVYNGVAVNVVLPDDSSRAVNVERAVRGHYDYALKRRRISKKGVDESMKLLSWCEASELEHCLEKCAETKCAVVVNVCAEAFLGSDGMMKAINSTFDKVVCVGVFPGFTQQQQSSSSCSVFVNLGDPLRNNTTVIEVTPATTGTPPEDVRITSALIAAAKKTPVVTPPSLYHSIGTHVLLSHWSLAVSLYYFYKGSVTSKSIDRTLMSAGYLKGPFQTMKKLGRLVIPLLTRQSTSHTRLKTYLETGTLPSFKSRRLGASKEDLVDLFNLNLILASLQAQKHSLGPFCEPALDLVCVGGLVGFPATEAGPLNYAVRLGRDRLISMVEDYSKRFPILVETSGTKKPLTVLSEENYKELFNKAELSLQNSSGGDLAECLRVQRAAAILLDHRELQMVQRCHGVVNSEVFLLPATVAFTLTVCFVFLVVVVSLLF